MFLMYHIRRAVFACLFSLIVFDSAHAQKLWRNLRLQPKTGFSRFPRFRLADQTGLDQGNPPVSQGLANITGGAVLSSDAAFRAAPKRKETARV
jgi:hypothetical protein